MPEQDKATGHDLHDLFRNVYQLKAVLDQSMDRIHEQSGMTTPWKRVLYVVEKGENVTVPDIAASLGVSRQFVLKTCNDMIKAGFVKYANNPRHKRSKLVLATEAAKVAYTGAERREQEIIKQVLPGVDAHAVQEATVLLSDLTSRLAKVGFETI